MLGSKRGYPSWKRLMTIYKRVTTLTTITITTTITLLLTIAIVTATLIVTSYTRSKRTASNNDSITYRWFMSWEVTIVTIITSNWHHARSSHLRRYFLGIRLHYLGRKSKNKRISIIGDCRHLLSRTCLICIITNLIVLTTTITTTNCSSTTTTNCSSTPTIKTIIKHHTAAHTATSWH